MPTNHSKGAILSTLGGDLWGALAATLVALPSAIAFGVLIFSSIDPSLAGQGAIYGMLGAATLGLIAPAVGGTAGLISAPCAPAAAVLAGLVGALLAADVEPSLIPGLLALTAALCAVMQFLFGVLRGGRFIKYIPYPVVSGFLSGVSLLIAAAQLPKLLGFAPGTEFLDGLLAPQNWQWPGILVGLVTIFVMLLAPRVTTRVPAAILALGSGVGTYLLLGLKIPELLSVQNNPLVIGPLEFGGSFVESVKTQFSAMASIQLDDIRLVMYPALALAALLSIDTLKTCVMLDALSRNRHDSNRELIGQGIGNFAAVMAGGMPGAGTTGPTLVNFSSGGTTMRSGIFEGIFVVLSLLVLAPLISWVPIATLAGILLVVAYRMFDWSAFKLLANPNTRFDFAVIAAVVVSAQTNGLITASAIGIGLAIMLFIRDQIRGSVLRRSACLREVSSKTLRLNAARDLLDQHGDLGGVYELQGNLFFGTTDQLLTRVEQDLVTRRWMLMDMRRVQSLDYTAANLFRQMHARLVEQNGGLLFCGMPSSLPMRQDIGRYLMDVGLVGNSKSGIKIFDTRDEALEWMEEQVLEGAGWTETDDKHALELGEFELLQNLDDATLAALKTCVKSVAFRSDTKIFSDGDSSDEVYLLRRGSVRILLPLPGGKHHHLATIGRGDFFGDMAFLDQGVRTADAISSSDGEVYVLSRADFDLQAHGNTDLGLRVFSNFARVVSLRLRHTNTELRMLEDR